MSARKITPVMTYRIVCTGCGSTSEHDKVPVGEHLTMNYECPACGVLEVDWNVPILPTSARGRQRHVRGGRRRTIRAVPVARR